MKKAISPNIKITSGVASVIIDGVQRLDDFKQRLGDAIISVPNLAAYLVGDIKPTDTDAVIAKFINDRSEENPRNATITEWRLTGNLDIQYHIVYERQAWRRDDEGKYSYCGEYEKRETWQTSQD